MPKPYIIREVANSHCGDFNKCLNLIEKFKYKDKTKLGTKFQIISPEKISLKDYKWHKIYKKLYFSKNNWKKIIQKAKKIGDVWLDIFDVYGVEIFKENLSSIYGIKLQSSVIFNTEVLQSLNKVNFKKKIILINVSGLKITEIKSIIDKIRTFSSCEIVIQAGFQSYPTNRRNIHLNKIQKLKKYFNKYSFSFADHLNPADKLFLELPSYAYSIGYKYVEKHICLNRKKTKYDFHSALEPEEFFMMMKRIESKNKFSKEALKYYFRQDFISREEKKYIDDTIQLPVVNHKIDKEKLISATDLYYRRTAQKGLSENEIKKKQSNFFILKKVLKKNSTIQHKDFRKLRVGAIVACRLKSWRLKNKALALINKKPAVKRCLESCLKIKKANAVILATSYLQEDRQLIKFNLKGRIKVFTGHPDDVISRYIKACNKFKIDVVMRLTGDCPYISNQIIEYMLKKHLESGSDYTRAMNAAPGTTGEIYNLSTLVYIKKKVLNTNLSEYMTWYVLNNKEHFKVNDVYLPSHLVRNYRLTLDYKEDLMMFNILYKKLSEKGLNINLQNIFKVLDKNKKISKINIKKKLIFKTNKKLINYLNKKTKFHE